MSLACFLFFFSIDNGSIGETDNAAWQLTITVALLCCYIIVLYFFIDLHTFHLLHYHTSQLWLFTAQCLCPFYCWPQQCVLSISYHSLVNYKVVQCIIAHLSLSFTHHIPHPCCCQSQDNFPEYTPFTHQAFITLLFILIYCVTRTLII